MAAAADAPVLIYDGNCGFCELWIEYWKQLTVDRVRYEASDDAPESVQLALAGETLTGARAVFTLLKEVPGRGWLACAYDSVPGFGAASEAAYRFIAAHRDLAYRTTVLLFGKPIVPATCARVAWLFEKLLAIVYAIAFLTFAVQARGLIGSRGILPLAHYLEVFRSTYGAGAAWMTPTLWWFNSSDAAILAVPILGVAASCLILAGIAKRASLAAAFILYLSICSGGQDFYSFQWDLLLLEAGFLAIFLGSNITVWLYRWLLFRLMFSSGGVKLLSGDPTWRNLTALTYHYHTQPLPTPLAWYADKLPLAFQRASTVVMLIIELVVPFLVFLPRRARHVAAAGLIGLQALILITGNYAFFNLLAILLCIFLFDDRDLMRVLPARWRGRTVGAVKPAIARTLAVALVVLGLAQLSAGLLGFAPGPVVALLRLTQPFGIVNGYGLFAVMTTTRKEIIVQCSQDGTTWVNYEFRWKPGDLKQAPRWVAPYQPRLDWQMWFAALGTYQDNPWFVNFMFRLLQGSRDVCDLMACPAEMRGGPKYVRALLFEYTFSDFETRRRTGQWWVREPRGYYLPPISMDNLREISRGSPRLHDEEAAFHAGVIDAVPDHAGVTRGAGMMEADHLPGMQVAKIMRGAESAMADVEQLAGEFRPRRIDDVDDHAAARRATRFGSALVLTR